MERCDGDESYEEQRGRTEKNVRRENNFEKMREKEEKKTLYNR